MDFDLQSSPRAQRLLEEVRRFVAERIAPVEEELAAQARDAPAGPDWRSWTVPPAIDALRGAAKSLGLWNLFLPDPELGAGLTNVEYAPIAEAMGRSLIAPEIFNCNAPDTGNMEVLYHYGDEAQKAAWLAPLLAGEIRSVFCMTEPDVASSDATNLEATVRADGDELVLDGRKWWATGLGHPRARVAIFMGRSDDDPSTPRHRRHSMVLVPLDAPGVTIRRMLPAFGEYDAPYGHGEVWFEAVRVPRANLIAGWGRGFEIAQGRLGPGRIHHCMRAIGAAERVLELMIRRGLERIAFGRPLVELHGNRERIAELRLQIDQARLLTLHAAARLDRSGALGALAEISAIKVVAPRVLERAVDEAIQMHGGAGMSRDTPLTAFYSVARSLRIADGPDAVHKALIARLELARHRERSAGGGEPLGDRPR